MAKELLNEAERFLLQRWAEACILEESMKTVRKKYGELFQRIVTTMAKAHPELDNNLWYLTQSWTSGYIAFGRKSWPADNQGPSGFCLYSLRLENLAAEDTDEPWASIRVSKKAELDLPAARDVLHAAAQAVLSRDELQRIEMGESDGLWLSVDAPSKAELLDLLSGGDGGQFVQRIVSQFELMARFVPALDKVFQECMKAK